MSRTDLDRAGRASGVVVTTTDGVATQAQQASDDLADLREQILDTYDARRTTSLWRGAITAFRVAFGAAIVVGAAIWLVVLGFDARATDPIGDIVAAAVGGGVALVVGGWLAVPRAGKRSRRAFGLVILVRRERRLTRSAKRTGHDAGGRSLGERFMHRLGVAYPPEMDDDAARLDGLRRYVLDCLDAIESVQFASRRGAIDFLKAGAGGAAFAAGALILAFAATDAPHQHSTLAIALVLGAAGAVIGGWLAVSSLTWSVAASSEFYGTWWRERRLTRRAKHAGHSVDGPSIFRRYLRRRGLAAMALTTSTGVAAVIVMAVRLVADFT